MKRKVANCPKCLSEKTDIFISSGGARGEFPLYMGKCSKCEYVLDSLGEGSESKAITEWNVNAVKIADSNNIQNLGLTDRQIGFCMKKLDK